jgi:hypothetical protein
LLGDRIALLEAGSAIGVFAPSDFLMSSDEHVRAYRETYQSSSRPTA